MAEQAFVAREKELAQLNAFLGRALAGHCQVCFVTGEAGAGKTALVTEFARRSQQQHPDLLVAIGNCNAQTGIGDPYLPFRQVLEMLTGNVEAVPSRHAISEENADRLRQFLRVSGQTIVDLGPDLIDIIIPGVGLATRAGTLLAEKAGWLDKLDRVLAHQPTGRGVAELDQRRIFEQYTKVLQALADKQPLLLVLDDLQWADSASIGLLFHLGRSIGASRILILGAYRPDDVALGRPSTSSGQAPLTGSGKAQRHPLEPVLNELKRYQGDIWVDLAQSDAVESRHFVDALLDTQPNRLAEDFRETLLRHTGGHPLFTTELLRGMQEGGDLVRDGEGRWVAQPSLDWEAFPPRVEGVIAERIGRLEDELRDILTVASVEGEDFTAQVVAQLEDLRERQLLQRLSRDLEQRHRLIREEGTTQLNSRFLSRYRFAHALFQQYLYNGLSEGERRLLHREIAQVLEDLYAGHTDEIPMELARHYLEAGLTEEAILHLELAGDRARRLVALDDAARYYRTALEYWPQTDKAGRAGVLRKLGECQWVLGQLDAAIDTFMTTYQLFDTLGDRLHAGATQRLIGRMYWEQADRARSLEHYHQALSILDQELESVELARVVSAISQMHMLASEYDQAITWGERALALAERLGVEDVTVHAMNNMGVSYAQLGRGEHGLSMLEESGRRAMELGLPHDACRAYYNMHESLEHLGRGAEARAVLERLLAYAERVNAALFIGSATVGLIKLAWTAGRWTDAFAHRPHLCELLARNQFAGHTRLLSSIELGRMYNDLGQPELARQELEPQLRIARGSREMQTTIPYLGQLARTYAALSMEAESIQLVGDIISWIQSVPQTDVRSTTPLLFACQWLAGRPRPEDVDMARACLAQLERCHAQIGGTPETTAALHEARGSLALAENQPQEAEAGLEAAVQTWQQLGRPYDRIRALAGLARALAMRGDAESTTATCHEALRLVEVLALQIEEPELRVSFLESPLVQELHDRREAPVGDQETQGD
jgi:predicted ATPase